MSFSERPRPQLTTETGKKVEIVPLAESLNENEPFGEQDFGGAELELDVSPFDRNQNDAAFAKEVSTLVDRRLESNGMLSPAEAADVKKRMEVLAKDIRAQVKVGNMDVSGADAAMERSLNNAIAAAERAKAKRLADDIKRRGPG